MSSGDEDYVLSEECAGGVSLLQETLPATRIAHTDLPQKLLALELHCG